VNAYLSPEQRTALYLESIRTSPGELRSFFLAMPKGADLHCHLQGAAYAEDIIDLAAKNGLCVDPATSGLSCGPCNPNRTVPVSRAYDDADMYNRLVDDWSIRGFRPSNLTLLHSFSSILKMISPAMVDYGSVISDLRSRAAGENVQYLETMIILAPQAEAASSLGRSLGWDDNLSRLHSRLMESGLEDLAENASLDLERYDNESESISKCAGSKKDGGCGVDIRYQYCALRTVPKEGVFAQLALAFEVAEKCPLVVGVNLVGPEDGWRSRHDYSLHMKMVGFLHSIHPGVRIDLNAGELALGSVPPEDLKFHISEAVCLGNASRIGHGAAIMEEDCSQDILEKMARLAVAVEITPVSSGSLPGVSDGDLPLAVYVDHGVPVVLGTDHPGMLRTDLSEQFVLATEQYPGINYSEIKRFVRNSLEYSFLPGPGLWARRGDYSMVVSACASDVPGAVELSPECLRCLEGSEKAAAQWWLEGDLADFEDRFEAVQVSVPQQASPETVKNVTEIGVPREIKHSVYKECSCCG
jgi:adenosine deaminase